MARPHPALIDLVAGRPVREIGDSGRLLRSSVEHRVYGLLWSAVERGDVEIPEADTAQLARWYLRSVARNQQIWATLDNVVRRLDELGVPAVVAKGVVAERRWYDRLGERPTSDIDVVLAPDAFPRIGEVVRAFDPGHPMVDELSSLAGRGWLQVIDVQTEWNVYIDLHFDLLKLDVPTRNRATIFERAVAEHTPQGTPIMAVDAEISLIHLLLHLNKDRFSHLLGLVDIRRILEREAIDWDFVDQVLEAEGFRTHAYRVLDVVASELEVELPAPPGPSRSWRGRAWDRLWPAGIRLEGQLGWLEHQRRQFAMPLIAPGRLWDGLGALRRRALPPRQLLRYHHPEGEGSYPRWLLTSRLNLAKKRHEMRDEARAEHFTPE